MHTASHTASRHGVVAVTTGLVLATGVVTGCGPSPSERRATEVEASAQAAAERARAYEGDPWERRAIAEHQRVPRSVQLAMDRALHDRLLRDH